MIWQISLSETLGTLPGAQTNWEESVYQFQSSVSSASVMGRWRAAWCPSKKACWLCVTPTRPKLWQWSSFFSLILCQRCLEVQWKGKCANMAEVQTLYYIQLSRPTLTPAFAIPRRTLPLRTGPIVPEDYLVNDEGHAAAHLNQTPQEEEALVDEMPSQDPAPYLPPDQVSPTLERSPSPPTIIPPEPIEEAPCPQVGQKPSKKRRGDSGYDDRPKKKSRQSGGAAVDTANTKPQKPKDTNSKKRASNGGGGEKPGIKDTGHKNKKPSAKKAGQESKKPGAQKTGQGGKSQALKRLAKRARSRKARGGRRASLRKRAWQWPREAKSQTTLGVPE